VRPRHLNAAVAVLFVIGSFGFALGATSSFASAVGPTPDAATFFIASIFFTAASFLQLVQSQSPAMAPTGTERDDERQHLRFLRWLPHDRAWLGAAAQFPGTLFFNGTTFWAITVAIDNSKYDQVVWRPDFYGSVLFLVASLFGILAVGPLLSWRPHEWAWWAAWLNMIGSIAFMASAIGAFVIPRTDTAVDLSIADRGTFVGAVCFLLGALCLFPAFRQAADAAAAAHARGRAAGMAGSDASGSPSDTPAS
jgi:hypothetical protein